MPRLDPTLDVVFKLLLTREPALLVDMLSGVLGRIVTGLTILDPDILGEQVGDKGIVLDVRAVLYDGSRVDVEMQLRAASALDSRLVYYGARELVEQLARGDGYELLRPSIVIVWMVEPLFPSLERLHAIFELRERHAHVRFGEQIAIHVLQLRRLPKGDESSYDPRVVRWARFLGGPDADLERLAAEDPIMQLAKQTLDRISEDPEVRRLAREREDAIKLHRMEIVASRQEGRVEGRAAALLDLLAMRFGPPPPRIRERIAAATPEQLVAWTRRVLDAQTPDEVVDGE